MIGAKSLSLAIIYFLRKERNLLILFLKNTGFLILFNRRVTNFNEKVTIFLHKFMFNVINYFLNKVLVDF